MKGQKTNNALNEMATIGGVTIDLPAVADIEEIPDMDLSSFEAVAELTTGDFGDLGNILDFELKELDGLEIPDFTIEIPDFNFDVGDD